MVTERFRSLFSRQKKERSESEGDKLVQELHDVFQGLEEARAEQLVLSSTPKEEKKEEPAPVSVEEEKEMVSIEESSSEIKSKETNVIKSQTESSEKLEAKTDKPIMSDTLDMGSVSNLFEVFKTEFLEYLVDKSVRDQKTRDLLFKALSKLEKEDLIEIIKIMYKIIDSKLSESYAHKTTSAVEQSKKSEHAEERKEKEEELDLSSLLGSS